MRKKEMNMDGKRIRISTDVEMQACSKLDHPKRTISLVLKPGTLMLTCLIFLPLLVLVLGATRNPSLEWLFSVGITSGIGSKNSSLAFVTDAPKDKLLGGLLSPDFDESSCLSRYQSALYWKQLSNTPSPYLIAKLRSYEALHRRCGPNTEPYKNAIQQLKSNHSAGRMECNYVVWVPSDGLGNRIMTIVSVFLYALLNDKVLLTHHSDDFRDLFCEPFPESSWVLPSDFPVKDLENLYTYTPWSSKNVLRKKADTKNVLPPGYLYVHLTHDARFSDHSFFCEEYQQLLQSFPWLLLRSNQYFVPALFRSSQYEKELSLLFPETTSVFHHLGRYLLHPTNSVWGYITRYYDAYLVHAEERVGLQIRIFPNVRISSEQMLDQILNCSLYEKLLPGIDSEGAVNPATWGGKLKAVLVTTLYSGYFEKLRNMYYEHATTTGELIAVYQPSHEEKQHTEQQNHNKKALMEMYLLSFSDSLITSGCSTFGYVAQGLGGLKPWILLRPEKESPACARAVSMEPCFHAPRAYQCIAETGRNAREEVARHVRQCEDVAEGLKIVN